MYGKKTKVLIRIIRIIVTLIFFTGILIIIFKPLEKSDITVKIDTQLGIAAYTISPQQIENLKQFKESYPYTSNLEIKEIRIYKTFKTICVQKIQSTDVKNYISLDKNTITFSTSFCRMLKELAASFFMERILGIEGLLAAFMFSWIVLRALDEKIISSDRDNHGPIYEIKRFFNDLLKYREYVFFAAKADLKAEVANSYLNRLWWILEPVFNMIVYVLVFGRIMGRSVQYYGTFVFSALLMYRYFSKTINYSVKCIRNNKDIVTKVYIPKYMLLISDMILNFYKLLFSVLVLIGMMLAFKIEIGWNIFFVIPAFSIMVFLSFGVGMIFLHFGVYIDDLSHAVGILLQMLMFLSGEFYDVIATLPSPLNVLMICINPVALFIDTMRNALLYDIAANLPLVGIWLFISILLCYMGIHIVYKNENGYVKVV